MNTTRAHSLCGAHAAGAPPRVRLGACLLIASWQGGLASWQGSRDRSPVSVAAPSPSYDFGISTAENHRSASAPLREEFMASRARLDYKYHARYSLRRQKLQDDIVRGLLREHAREPASGAPFAAWVRRRVAPAQPALVAPERPWAIFTAGCMGAGKTHVMRLLDRHGLLPLQNFARIDLDQIRMQLPEIGQYMRLSRLSAGRLTQAEAGTIAEIATEEALRRGLHVWVDSSLKDAEWWTAELRRIREVYPAHRLGVVYVRASWAQVKSREAKRGKATGRSIPEELLRDVYEKVPKAIGRYRGLVDETVVVDNDGEHPCLATAADVAGFLRVCKEAHSAPAQCGAGPAGAEPARDATPRDALASLAARLTGGRRRAATPFTAWQWFAGGECGTPVRE